MGDLTTHQRESIQELRTGAAAVVVVRIHQVVVFQVLQDAGGEAVGVVGDAVAVLIGVGKLGKGHRVRCGWIPPTIGHRGGSANPLEGLCRFVNFRRIPQDRASDAVE